MKLDYSAAVVLGEAPPATKTRVKFRYKPAAVSEQYIARRTLVDRLAKETLAGERDHPNVSAERLRLATRLDGPRLPLTFRSWRQLDAFRKDCVAAIEAAGCEKCVRIAIVGSAVRGWSCNPLKPVSPWSESSDADFQVISRETVKTAFENGVSQNMKVENICKSNGLHGFYRLTPLGRALREVSRKWAAILFGNDADSEMVSFKLTTASADQVGEGVGTVVDWRPGSYIADSATSNDVRRCRLLSRHCGMFIGRGGARLRQIELRYAVKVQLQKLRLEQLAGDLEHRMVICFGVDCEGALKEILRLYNQSRAFFKASVPHNSGVDRAWLRDKQVRQYACRDTTSDSEASEDDEPSNLEKLFLQYAGPSPPCSRLVDRPRQCCAVCGEVFPSRNQLFIHLEHSGHVRARPECKASLASEDHFDSEDGGSSDDEVLDMDFPYCGDGNKPDASHDPGFRARVWKQFVESSTMLAKLPWWRSGAKTRGSARLLG